MFVAPELIGGAVGFFIRKDVVERADPRCKPTDLPNALEGRLPLIVGDLERSLREEIDVSPGEGLRAPVIYLRILLDRKSVV